MGKLSFPLSKKVLVLHHDEYRNVMRKHVIPIVFYACSTRRGSATRCWHGSLHQDHKLVTCVDLTSGRSNSMAFQFPSVSKSTTRMPSARLALKFSKRFVMKDVHRDCYLPINWLAPSTELPLFWLLHLAQFTPSVFFPLKLFLTYHV